MIFRKSTASEADTFFLTFFIRFTILRCSAENCGIIRRIEGHPAGLSSVAIGIALRMDGIAVGCDVVIEILWSCVSSGGEFDVGILRKK